MISAHRIVMNGISSDEFDIIGDLSLDSDNGTKPSFLNQDGVSSEHYNGRRTIHRLKNNEYFSPVITFIKNDYSEFDTEEHRRILSWLTASDKPGWIEFYKDDSNVIEYQIFGGVENLELYKLSNGRVIGYVVTFMSTHPHAFSRHTKITESTTETTSFVVTCDTDEYGKVLYPTVTIRFKGDNVYFPAVGNPNDVSYYMIPNVVYKWGDELYANVKVNEGAFRTSLKETSQLEPTDVFIGQSKYWYVKGLGAICEITTNGNAYIWKPLVKVGAAVQITNDCILNGNPMSKKMEFKGAAIGDTVTCDGTNKVIYSTSENLDNSFRMIGDDFNLEWLPLAYGDNKITITGNCEVALEWIEPRKIGDL